MQVSCLIFNAKCFGYALVSTGCDMYSCVCCCCLGIVLSNHLKADQQIRRTWDELLVPAGGLNSGPLVWRGSLIILAYVSVCMCALVGNPLQSINRSDHELWVLWCVRLLKLWPWKQRTHWLTFIMLDSKTEQMTHMWGFLSSDTECWVSDLAVEYTLINKKLNISWVEVTLVGFIVSKLSKAVLRKHCNTTCHPDLSCAKIHSF